MLPGHKSLNTGLRSGNAAAEAYNLTSGTLFSRFAGGKNRFFCNIFHQKKKGEGLSTSTPTFLISFLESGEDFPVSRLSLKPTDGNVRDLSKSHRKNNLPYKNKMSTFFLLFFPKCDATVLPARQKKSRLISSGDIREMP